MIMSKVLVTGNLGFIGSHLTDALVKEHEVLAIDNESTGKIENLNPKAFFMKEDITTFNFDYLPKVDVVFHVAALPRIQPSIINPQESHLHNAFGSLRVFDYARKCGAKVVFSSSSSVYGKSELMNDEANLLNPGSPYALDKLYSEQALELFKKLYGFKYTALRYFNVYGERQLTEGAYATVIGIFLKQLKEGKPFTITSDGEQRRDFTYVKDVVRANLLAGFGNAEGIINIGTGTNWSINEVADMVSKTHPREYLPERPGECRKTLANNSKAFSLLGWESTINLPEWIHTTLAS